MDVECLTCKHYVPVEMLDIHETTCIKKVELTDVQQKALLYVMKKSSIFSKAVKYNLLEKINKNDMKLLHSYVKNRVNTVIHINLDKILTKILDDTEYRNQFETGISGGSLSKTMRDDWEKQLFYGIYLNSAGPEKVKYGAINITNDPYGVRSAHGYGDSYFVLKPETKFRTSFVFGDSSTKDLHIANYKNFNSVLLYIAPILNEVVEVASGVKPYSTVSYTYIEAQIHGPILFNRDVASLVVNPKYKQYSENHHMLPVIEEFCTKNGIDLVFADEL